MSNVAQRRVKLSSGALEGRFKVGTGAEVLEDLEKGDERIHDETASLLHASGLLAGKMKVSEFKRLYVAFRIFGENGAGALAGALRIAINKGFEEGVSFLVNLCSLHSWKAAVEEAARMENFEMVLSKLQLDDFATEDFEAGFPSFDAFKLEEETPAATIPANAPPVVQGEKVEEEDPNAFAKKQLTDTYNTAVMRTREPKRTAIKAVYDALIKSIDEGSYQVKEGSNLVDCVIAEMRTKAEEIKNPAKKSASFKSEDEEATQAAADLALKQAYEARAAEQAPVLVKRIIDAVATATDKHQTVVFGATCEAFHGLTHYFSNRDFVRHGKKAHVRGENVVDLMRNVAVAVIDKEKNADLWEAEEAYCKKYKYHTNTLPVIILDGHTRRYNRGEFIDGKPVLAHPESLIVAVHFNHTDKEFQKIVDTYCGKEAAYDKKDSASTAKKALLADWKSDFVDSYWANSATLCDEKEFVYSNVSIKDKTELERVVKSNCLEIFDWLDTLNLSGTAKEKAPYIQPGIRAGILDTFALCKKAGVDYQLAKDFWQDFYSPLLSVGGVAKSQHVKSLTEFVLCTGEGKTAEDHERGKPRDLAINKQAREEFNGYMKVARHSVKK